MLLDFADIADTLVEKATDSYLPAAAKEKIQNGVDFVLDGSRCKIEFSGEDWFSGRGRDFVFVISILPTVS